MKRKAAMPLTPALSQALQAAYAQFQRSDFGGADRALRALRMTQPNQPDVLHLHALVQRAAGDLFAARASLVRAADLQPTAERFNTLGNMAISAGEITDALAAFQQALSIDGNYVPALINLAQCEGDARRLGAGLAFAELAVRLQPGSVLAHTTLARLQRETGQHDAAIATARRSIALQPGQPGSYVHLGLALAAAGRPSDALAAYDTAAAAGYTQPQLEENRIAALLDTGSIDAATRAADALVGASPEYMPGHRLRVRIYWEYGLEGDAFAALHAVARAGGNKSAWAELIEMHMEHRQFATARRIIDEARNAGAYDARMSFAEAVAASEQRDDDGADRLFNMLEPQLAGSDDFLTAMARHWLRRKDAGRAEHIAGMVAGRDPTNQLAWAYRGTAWRLLGDARAEWLHDYDRMVVFDDTFSSDREAREAFVTQSAEALRALHRTRVHPANQSLRYGTQTPGSLFDRPERAVQMIRDTALAAAKRMAANLPSDDKHPFYARASQSLAFAGSWSVRLTRYGHHINHIHQAGWMSSAFYFALPAPGPCDGPQAGHLQLGAPPEDLGLDLPPIRIIAPREGALALFPSSMWHGTLPFTSDGERLTAAFDIVPT